MNTNPRFSGTSKHRNKAVPPRHALGYASTKRAMNTFFGLRHAWLRAGLVCAGLNPALAQATGGPGCGADLLCAFLLWNAGVGLMLLVLPLSAALFAGLYYALGGKHGAPWRRAGWGALHGIAVFETASLAAAVLVPWAERKAWPVPGQPLSFMTVYGVLLFAYLVYLYARRRRGSVNRQA